MAELDLFRLLMLLNAVQCIQFFVKADPPRTIDYVAGVCGTLGLLLLAYHYCPRIFWG